ncbi:MAG TPA: PBP1A family penicillin-binding protein [Pyrinomonadaceae bacterium]|nr:PBP1A family penicillin-binding protein [Pyrinomonadaceae bacterium]
MRAKQRNRFGNRAPQSRAVVRVRRFVRISIAIIAIGVISLSIFLAQTYRSYAKIVDARLAHGYLTSRAGIYAAPRTLRVGQKYSPAQLIQALRSSGYAESDSVSDVWNGSFSTSGNLIDIRPSKTGTLPSTVRVTLDGERIANLTGDDIALESFTLAPESLSNDSFTRSAARTQLAFADIPPLLVHAITSIEDRRFFDHPGLDVFGVARALLRNAGSERIGQGGSTITQQLVKNTYLTPERTFRRKFAEAMLSFTIERRLSKQDIFALYCNEIFLGQRDAIAVRGVEQAARIYFGKELKDLTLGEAATIAGMIQSPTRYSPIRQNEAARVRRNTVLGAMLRDGFITPDQATAATNEPVPVADFDSARETVAPYFIDYVNRLLKGGQGSSPTEQAQDVPATVTTLDLDLQKIASEAIKHQLDRLDETYKSRGVRPQAALVALDPRTGNVLAMIGGRDYAESQLNRAVDARRQPGSVFKPFVYAAALESGMSPLRMFTDAPQEFSYAHNQKYRPANYGGGFSMRDVPMRDGLIKSLNVVTVDVAMQTGLARVANVASRFGLPRPSPYPALALGTTEATPVQVAAAYAAFVNGGRRIQPLVFDGGGHEAGDQVIAPTTAFMITDMLQGVVDHGTARGARGAIKQTAVAGKTGTSRDGWFVGYTPNLVCAVWIGFDDNKQLGLTGAEAALPAWVEFMKGAVDLKPELGGQSFDQPEGITVAEIDPETDGLATGKCPSYERVAMLSSQAPTSECFRHNVYFDLRDDLSLIPNRAVAKSEDLRANQRQNNTPKEFTSLLETQIATDNVGRKVLVNDLRTAGR